MDAVRQAAMDNFGVFHFTIYEFNSKTGEGSDGIENWLTEVGKDASVSGLITLTHGIAQGELVTRERFAWPNATLKYDAIASLFDHKLAVFAPGCYSAAYHGGLGDRQLLADGITTGMEIAQQLGRVAGDFPQGSARHVYRMDADVVRRMVREGR